ncbi:FMN-binding protein [Micromonospora purpureochromogenes]|uniref:FMN-binding protein n=1 Tax=Micromonospora purpureochromogenes TaxID=47872 RepID=UPI0036308B39
MRRAILAITGLAASTSALVVLKGAPGASQVAQGLPADQASVAPAAGDPGTAGGVRPAPRPAASASGRAPAARPTTGAPRTPAARSTTGTRAPAAPRTTTAAPKPALRTVSGSTVNYEYGSLSVQITLSGSRIVNVTGIGLPQSGQSGQRSDDVQRTYSGTSGEVVQKQSADLNTVSDATATSDAYQQSLQAAIDRAG